MQTAHGSSTGLLLSQIIWTYLRYSMCNSGKGRILEPARELLATSATTPDLRSIV